MSSTKERISRDEFLVRRFHLRASRNPLEQPQDVFVYARSCLNAIHSVIEYSKWYVHEVVGEVALAEPIGRKMPGLESESIRASGTHHDVPGGAQEVCFVSSCSAFSQSISGEPSGLPRSFQS
jgi:hypothetical protein